MKKLQELFIEGLLPKMSCLLSGSGQAESSETCGFTSVSLSAALAIVYSLGIEQ